MSPQICKQARCAGVPGPAGRESSLELEFLAQVSA